MRAFTRWRAERYTFPDHLPRERVVIDPPTACTCCGGNRLHKLARTDADSGDDAAAVEGD